MTAPKRTIECDVSAPKSTIKCAASAPKGCYWYYQLPIVEKKNNEEIKFHIGGVSREVSKMQAEVEEAMEQLIIREKTYRKKWIE